MSFNSCKKWAIFEIFRHVYKLKGKPTVEWYTSCLYVDATLYCRAWKLHDKWYI